MFSTLPFGPSVSEIPLVIFTISDAKVRVYSDPSKDEDVGDRVQRTPTQELYFPRLGISACVNGLLLSLTASFLRHYFSK